MQLTDTIALNDGHAIPRIGLGVWEIPQTATAQVVATGIKLGYRLIDGAFVYANEAGMGEGLRQGGVARENLFVTSKIWNSDQGRDSARKAIQGSLARIGVDYLDLVLIHWPCPSKDLYVETWEALIEAREAGLVRSIGVSNFEAEHLDRLIAATGVTPALNQIEVNLRLQQARMREANRTRGIVTQSWTPLGQGASFDAAEIAAICARTGKSPAQVILRWHLQLGVSVIPRSTKREHMASNIDLFDFELTQGEMQALTRLDEGVRTGPDPAVFEAD
jgi:2,5-diketo-D-gluconate reductase A